jgi:hypothetical protein
VLVESFYRRVLLPLLQVERTRRQGEREMDDTQDWASCSLAERLNHKVIYIFFILVVEGKNFSVRRNREKVFFFC